MSDMNDHCHTVRRDGGSQMKNHHQTDQGATREKRDMIPTKTPYRIVLIYVVAGIGWVLFSDIFLAYFITDPDQFLMLQTYKGWFYVLITGLLLYVLIDRDFNKIMNYQSRLISKYAELEKLMKPK
jgi:hypothetical protein